MHLGLASFGEIDTNLKVAVSDISEEELLSKDLLVFKELLGDAEVWANF